MKDTEKVREAIRNLIRNEMCDSNEEDELEEIKSRSDILPGEVIDLYKEWKKATGIKKKKLKTRLDNAIKRNNVDKKDVFENSPVTEVKKKLPTEIVDLLRGYNSAKGSVLKKLYMDKLLQAIKYHKLDKDDVFETSSVTGMGGGDSYMTPGAFSKPGADPKKKRALKNNKWELVESKINLRDKKITPQHRLNKAVGYARKQMNEIEKVINRAIKFKTENNMPTDIYWSRTHGSLKKLGEQLVRISHKLNEFK